MKMKMEKMEKMITYGIDMDANIGNTKCLSMMMFICINPLTLGVHQNVIHT